MTNTSRKEPIFHLNDWECGNCRASGTKDHAIVIEDSDESDDGIGTQNPPVEVVNLTRGIKDGVSEPAALEPLTGHDIPEEPLPRSFISLPPMPPPTTLITSPKKLFLSAQRHEIKFRSPLLPPANGSWPSASTPHPKTFVASLAASKQVIEDLPGTNHASDAHPTPFAKNNQAPLPQDFVIRAHQAHSGSTQPPCQHSWIVDGVPRLPRILSSQALKFHNLSQDPDICDDDNLRNQHRPPRLPNAPHGSQPIQKHSAPQQGFGGGEAERFKVLLDIETDDGDEDGAGYNEDDGLELDVDVLRAGWPDGYLEPPLPFEILEAHRSKAGEDNRHLELQRRANLKPWFPENLSFMDPASSQAKASSRDNAFPRFDMFYKGSPNPGDATGGSDTSTQVPRGKRRKKPKATRRLEPEMMGPEVIYLAPNRVGLGRSTPGDGNE
ncbi:hypothetical protein FRB96_003898 [Tulasnella sp. 330]|nr:hypothetical protein FRB96_003898 [Tulasnella sp. 330]KAG8871206.1 hypothetical protein FRB97_008908 [Tulasnella sp. 331]KAG8875305.1 hypothetical protein FRB98_007992 [Tulasnella sp. 332]